MRMGSDEVQPPELLGLRDGGNWLFDGEKSAMEPEALNQKKGQLTAAIMMIQDIEELEQFLFDQISLSLPLSVAEDRKEVLRSPMDKAFSPPGRIACPLPKKFAAFAFFCLRENKIEKVPDSCCFCLCLHYLIRAITF